MPPSGTCTIIHAKEGLNIKSIFHLYKETHAISHATSRRKADTQVNVTLDTRLEHEIKWTRKNSVTVYSESQFHQTIDSAPDDQQSVMQVRKTVKKNICYAMLDRYLWRHNSILSYLYSLALSGNITDNITYSDLSNANMPGISTILIDITITTQRPDLVIVNRINSTITILELLVPFETNISDTHNI